MAIERTIRYTGKDVTVLWKPHLCTHSTRCWKGLAAVFKPLERPWIHPDSADAARVIAQVHQCPSGALSIATSNADMQCPPATENDGYGTMPGPSIDEGHK